MAYKRIAVIPGDGIGIDVTAEAVKVIRACGEKTGRKVEIVEYDYGAEKYLKTGISMPPGGYDDLRTYDAIFMGAFGDPRVPDMKHAADILLGTRFVLDLYVNYRPVKLYSDPLCPLKDIHAGEIDMAIVRENTEGLYVGVGGNFKKNTPDEIAIQEDINTRRGVQRIIEYAFEFAVKNRRKKVLMADKANVLTYGHDLWQRVFKEVSAKYPQIESSHMYVDALTMQMVLHPKNLDVIVTCNMFGDIITDLGAALQGGLGMAASANINPNGTSMFEPVHGSAPDIAGKGVANPTALMLSSVMMLNHLGELQAADRLRNAIESVYRDGKHVPHDVGGTAGTAEFTDAVCTAVKT